MNDSPEDRIRARIVSQGRITFAEFMEIALYHPTGGYYAGGATGGARDYYTSPAAHPAFGALITVQLNRMWELLERPAVFRVIEMGAGSGVLARDILDYARHLAPGLSSALSYVALDRSHLKMDTGKIPRSFERVTTDGVPFIGIVGCLLSNELLDSFPVHRFEVRDGLVREVYVTVRGDELVEMLDEPSTPLMARRLDCLDEPLPEGYRGEVNLMIGPWMEQVAGALESGFVVTIDYGHESSELYAPRRRHGTLQTYYRHTQAASPYQRVGAQDMTAHVDFSAVIAEGGASGLRAIGLTTQSEYLRCLGFERMVYELRRARIGQRERDANLMALRELIKPQGLGGFKVLVQEKGTGVTNLGRLKPPRLLPGEMGEGRKTVPLLKPYHVSLMEARYPHLSWDIEELWPWNTG